jgi:hypothetical protein
MIVGHRPTFPGFTELSVEQARTILDTAVFRLTRHPALSGRGWTAGNAYTTIELMLDGNWLELCRTDLADNVATGRHENWTVAEWVAYYRERIRHGARYDARIFAVIDRFTDG